MVTNKEFLQAIFGDEYNSSHVTDFTYDPLGIPSEKHGISWAGNRYDKYKFNVKPSNQYYTVSQFNPEKDGKSRRRKSLFKQTNVIVLDDVREKLPIEQVNLLPEPSYILLSSPGSEQWGYILDTPCSDQNIIDNLLDGLIANGLAPDSKDPGMRGVTRYVRLPNGVNTKKSKMVDGIPFQCELLKWSPFFRFKLDELADPFSIDLKASRKSVRLDGATEVKDHPILNTCVNIKNILSPGRYDITCPWVDSHTDKLDNGSVVFTNKDGTIGFKCHHGSCQDFTAIDFLKEIEKSNPGISKKYKEWCSLQAFKDIKEKTNDLYATMIYIRNLDRVYDYRTKIWYKIPAFHNSFSDVDPDCRKNAVNGVIKKVDMMDFSPGRPKTFIKDGVKYGNTWEKGYDLEGVEGDCSKWLDHWDKLGWGENKNHMLRWMAYTILHPGTKINHILLLGGPEGVGKDFLLYPLQHAIPRYSKVNDGSSLLSDYTTYLLNTKYLHFNETELGDHKAALKVTNKLKPLAAAPPETLPVNEKHVSQFDIQNIVNVSMSTNSQLPIRLNGNSRRYYAVWSDLNIWQAYKCVKPEWKTYWKDRWAWIREGGVDACIWYLRNKVDLSDFDPGETPDITQFMQDIREASKSPGEQTIEAFIQNKIGAFASDLLTAQDASNTLRSGIIGCDNFMYITASWFTPTKVGRILNDMTECVKRRAKRDVDIKPWIIRNREEYEKLTPAELYDEYERQISNIPVQPTVR